MTASDRPRITLITGATRGIGQAVAERLAEQPGVLVVVGRSDTRTRDLAGLLAGKAAKIETIVGDLSVQDGVHKVADRFLQMHDRLDLLINNAGAYFTRREITPDGLEKTFALNHVGYFLLTQRLLPALEAAAPSRIVNVASDAHRGARMNWDDLQMERSWSQAGFGAYGQSKLANILFTRELARRIEGTGVTANCLHPGFVNSGFARNNGLLGSFFMTVSRPFQRSTAKAAAGIVAVATDPALDGVNGQYFLDGKRHKPTRAARSDEDAARLWEITEGLVVAAPHQG